MHFHIELTARASRDLVRIFTFINAETDQPARRWFREMHAAIGTLSQMPERCPFTPESKQHRHLLYGEKPDVYRIIFRINSRIGKVIITHVRHGARDAFRR